MKLSAVSKWFQMTKYPITFLEPIVIYVSGKALIGFAIKNKYMQSATEINSICIVFKIYLLTHVEITAEF